MTDHENQLATFATNQQVFRYSIKLSFGPSDLDLESHIATIAATKVALTAKKTAVRRVFNLSTQKHTFSAEAVRPTISFRLDSVRQFKKEKLLDRRPSSLY